MVNPPEMLRGARAKMPAIGSKMPPGRAVLLAAFIFAIAFFHTPGDYGQRNNFVPPPSLPPVPPALYLFSLLNNQAPDGPQIYTSFSGTSLQPLRKPGGVNLVPNTPQFRDGRFLHAGHHYYYSFTHGGAPSHGIGLLESYDLQNWSSVATPDWGPLFRNGEDAIWNGAWWSDSGTYYMFFGVCHRLVPTCRPYFVPFTPSSNTFGAPQPISFTTNDPHTYSIVMSIFQSAGKNWALLQTLDASGRSVVALASFTSLTDRWETDWNMIGGQHAYRESGAAIVLPNGHPRVYYVRNAGGELFYTTADGSDPGSATWSAPQTIPPFRPGFQPADWVDVVPISDAETLQDIAKMRGVKLGTSQ